MKNKILKLLVIFCLIPKLCFSAISAGCVWEFRPASGDNLNGGGYITGSSGIDYTQQADPILELTDCATAGIGDTTLTSATGGFTEAMKGNLINLSSGTNLTVNWYEITGYTDTNTVTLDRAPDDGVGGVSGAVGRVGGALATFTAAFVTTMGSNNDDQYAWVKNDGTMVFTENVYTYHDGDTDKPLIIEGYNLVRGDNPHPAINPTKRTAPFIYCGVYDFNVDNQWYLRNFYIETSDANGVNVDGGDIHNLCIRNVSLTAYRRCLFPGQGFAYNIELQSCRGNAIIPGQASFIMNAYIHDSYAAMGNASNDNSMRLNWLVVNCDYGAKLSAGTNWIHWIHNTFYNCTYGAYSNSTPIMRWFDNNFVHCTTAMEWTGGSGNTLLDYNNFWDCDTDVTGGLVKGDHTLAVNPFFKDVELLEGSQASYTGSTLDCEESVDLSRVIVNESFIWIKSGDGLTYDGHWLITDVDDDNDQVTTEFDIGESTDNNWVWCITVGNDFTPSKSFQDTASTQDFGEGYTHSYSMVGSIERKETNTIGAGTTAY